MKARKVFYFFIFLSYFFNLDYKNGFGGQLGVQSDRKDKSAAGWEDHEQLQRHVSQKGFLSFTLTFPN